MTPALGISRFSFQILTHISLLVKNGTQYIRYPFLSVKITVFFNPSIFFNLVNGRKNVVYATSDVTYNCCFLLGVFCMIECATEYLRYYLETNHVSCKCKGRHISANSPHKVQLITLVCQLPLTTNADDQLFHIAKCDGNMVLSREIITFLSFSVARSCVRSDMFEYCKNGSDVFAATSLLFDGTTQVCCVLDLVQQYSCLLKHVTYQPLEHLTATLSCCVYIWLSGPCTKSNNQRSTRCILLKESQRGFSICLLQYALSPYV